MKVISLKQPWATLVVIGAKKIETRSFKTKYKGPLLIHASQYKNINELRVFQCSWSFDAALHSLGGTMTSKNSISLAKDLPFGAIIGSVELDECRPTESFTVGELETKRTERMLGDYSPGRYGWLLSNPSQFENPIVAKGQLGFWDYDLQNQIV